jgi:hypothetical protein
MVPKSIQQRSARLDADGLVLTVDIQRDRDGSREHRVLYRPLAGGGLGDDGPEFIGDRRCSAREANSF